VTLPGRLLFNLFGGRTCPVFPGLFRTRRLLYYEICTRESPPTLEGYLPLFRSLIFCDSFASGGSNFVIVGLEEVTKERRQLGLSKISALSAKLARDDSVRYQRRPALLGDVEAGKKSCWFQQLLMRMRVVPSNSHYHKVVLIYLRRANVLTSSYSLPLNRYRQISR
jgi:hypothetical protein